MPAQSWDAERPPPGPACKTPYGEPLPDGATARMGTRMVQYGSFVRAAFLPDGKHVATGSFYGPVHLWEVATGRVVARMHGYDSDNRLHEGMRALAALRGHDE